MKPLNEPLPLPGHEDEEVELVSSAPAHEDRLSTLSRARVRAIDVAYEVDMRDGASYDSILEERKKLTAAQTPLPEFSIRLAQVAANHEVEIDEMISTHSVGWPLDRMPAVDRAILRVGVAELIFGDKSKDNPASVVIGQYATIARRISTEDSPRFVNGLLQRIVDMREMLS